MKNKSAHPLKTSSIDALWIQCARDIGVIVVRGADAYASYDGCGALLIGADETLDKDDSLAQLIFHELCHSLVQGASSFQKVDWGLDLDGEAELGPEYQALKIQARLSSEVGLFEIFQPTTEHKKFYLSLKEQLDGEVQKQDLMQEYLEISLAPPWDGALQKALKETRRIVALSFCKRGDFRLS